MLKTTIFLLSGLTAVSAYAADIKPCYLALMPLDIQNRILSFVPCDWHETEAEFVERTEYVKEVPHNVLYPYSMQARRTHSQQVSTLGSHAAYSPDNSKMILSENLVGDGVETTITVAHLATKKVLYNVYPKIHTGAVGLSRDARTFAFIYYHTKTPKGQYDPNPQGEYRIRVENAAAQEAFVLIIPNEYESKLQYSIHTSLDFNKQGTQLILHCDGEVPFTRIHTIFTLASDETVKQGKTSTLQEYLKRSLVCKAFSNPAH